MSEDNPRGLQRFNVEQRLPMGFDELPEEDQRALLRRMSEKHVDIMADAARAIAQSRTAENDLDVFNQNIAQRDHDRKIYSDEITAKTGSGQIVTKVRGGDTRFIVPILVVIGIILLALIALLALR